MKRKKLTNAGFNKLVKKKLGTHAKKIGWKTVRGKEPMFKKGKAEVLMHTGDGVIFAYYKGNPTKTKNYGQDMNLFSGNYTKSNVKRYIEHGKKTMTQMNKKEKILKKLHAKRKKR